MTPAHVVTIENFEPPMCCPTGLCGPRVDRALLDISEATLKIRTEHNGRAAVERYVLAQQPAQFTQQAGILDRLRTHGVAVLPVTLVDGVVLKERSYPSYADMRRWIEADATSARSGDQP